MPGDCCSGIRPIRTIRVSGVDIINNIIGIIYIAIRQIKFILIDTCQFYICKHCTIQCPIVGCSWCIIDETVILDIRCIQIDRIKILVSDSRHFRPRSILFLICTITADDVECVIGYDKFNGILHADIRNFHEAFYFARSHIPTVACSLKLICCTSSIIGIRDFRIRMKPIHHTLINKWHDAILNTLKCQARGVLVSTIWLITKWNSLHTLIV